MFTPLTNLFFVFTGPLNRRALLDYINEQAKKMPDKPEQVPYVPGVVRGTKWVPPKQEHIMEGYGFEDDIELDLGTGYL